MSKYPVRLAGASEEKERVKLFADRLATTGLVRTFSPWWELTRGADHAIADNDAGVLHRDHAGSIEECKLFWLLAPVRPSRGAYWEVGYAANEMRHFDSSIRIYVSGPAWSASIFTREPQVRTFDSDEDAFEEIVKLASKWADHWAAKSVVP